MNKFNLGILLLSLLFLSCSKTVYLSDMQLQTSYTSPSLELKIQEGDQLTIFVNAKNPEVAAPFNIHSGITYQVSDEKRLKTEKNTTPGLDQNACIVGKNGKINFPIIGEIYAKNLTCEDLEYLLKNHLISGNYIKDPLVRVNIINSKIDVMGEITRPGTIALPRTGMNILQAISQSGGLTNNALAGKVRVIRQVAGVRTMYEADICSTELFESPCFVLQQNDLVYILPRSGKMSYRGEKGVSFISTAISVASLIVSIFVLIK
ncbi:MAG: polysaccharide biosynthesis/export family protein [Bacteroidales bacterium]